MALRDTEKSGRLEQKPTPERLEARASAVIETEKLVADVNSALALFSERGALSGRIGDLFGMDMELTEPPNLNRAETEVS